MRKHDCDTGCDYEPTSRYKMDVEEIAPVDVTRPRYEQLSMPEFQALAAGTVVLVRSTAVPYLGDHYFMVTGPLVQKPHGLRPQGVSVRADHEASRELDKHSPQNGVIALRLNDTRDIARFLRNRNLASLVI